MHNSVRIADKREYMYLVITRDMFVNSASMRRLR